MTNKESVIEPSEQISSASLEVGATDNTMPSFIPLSISLIRDILEQITCNDAPAGNEIVASIEASSNGSNDTTKSSTMWPVVVKNGLQDVNVGEIEGATSLDTDMTEANVPVVVNSGNPKHPLDSFECYTQQPS